MELDILKIWPDWKATKLLGEGSFGKVYEIVRNNFGIEEHCALKVITIPPSPAELQSMKNEGMDDASATAYYKGLVEEFVQEIALMSKLKGNVNIVGYEDYAVIEHEDSIGWDIIIRMELLTALPAYIKDHSFTVNDVIKLATDVCNALEVCHEQKIIHRDIKPDNIFASQNGDYKLGDFGVARTIEKAVSGLSKKGTYTYMAPEVYKGEAYGTNVDLYSLGIVMYKLLNNNREPFLPPHPELIKYSDKNDALVKRMNGDIIPPPANCNELLSRVILKSISFKSWERYQLPSQMKADLQSVKNSLGSGIEPILQADHIAASNIYSTGKSFNSAQQQNNSYMPNNSYTPNNSYVQNNSYRLDNSFVSNNPVANGREMKVATFKCPHCGNNLGAAVNAYLYGSPFRVCNKCKNSYVDNRYHEIAIEGIRREDINPTEVDKRSYRKSGWKAIWIGVGMIALFIIILFTGWIVFPLPIFGVISLIGGIGAMKGDSQKKLEKTRRALEIERQQSMLRIQNPQYVEQLRAIGYNIQTNAQPAGATYSSQNTCRYCGTALEQNDRFCSKCGTPH